MTWNEFKQLVDQRLAEQGSDGDVEVGIIDIGHGVAESFLAVEVAQREFKDAKRHETWRELTISD